MDSMSFSFHKRVTLAANSQGSDSVFQIPLPNGVTVHLLHRKDDALVAFLTYQNPSEPPSNDRYVSVKDGSSNDPRLLDTSLDAEMLLEKSTEVAAFIELASKICFKT